MKLGIVLPYSSADMSLPIDRVLEAERLGFDSVWTSEAYGSDAVTPAAWVLARTWAYRIFGKLLRVLRLAGVPGSSSALLGLDFHP